MHCIVHTLWASGKLSLLERLSITLLQQHGHEVHLWSYEPIKNVPLGTVLRDARDILPYESVFTFQGTPLNGIPNGGIGSLSHWSDQFQLMLLHKEGGIYVQLDVSCLKPLVFKNEYAFIAHHGTNLAAFLMKCPKGAVFPRAAYKVISQYVNASQMSDMHWDFSMRLMGIALKQSIPNCMEYVIHPKCVMDLGCRKDGPFFDSTEPNSDQCIIHWSNATVKELKDNPIPGSYYYKLLQSCKLI